MQLVLFTRRKKCVISHFCPWSHLFEHEIYCYKLIPFIPCWFLQLQKIIWKWKLYENEKMKNILKAINGIFYCNWFVCFKHICIWLWSLNKNIATSHEPWDVKRITKCFQQNGDEEKNWNSKCISLSIDRFPLMTNANGSNHH